MVDVGGRALHAQVMGEDDPAVVLEAGIAASSISWALVAPEIAKFTTVVSYDRAGFGWSDPPLHRSTALDAVQDLAVLLERLGIREPVVLVGHSFGGLIARVFQQRYADRVAAVVLVDPVCRALWRDASEQRLKMLARGVMLSRRGELLARVGVVRLALKMVMSGSRLIPKVVARASAGRGAGVAERLTGEVRKMPKELWPAVAAHWSEARCFRAMANALENLPASVRQIDESRTLGDLPVRVLSAASANAAEKHEHASDATLSTRGEHVVVDGAGHWLQLDVPEAVVEAVRQSLRILT
jgi:pimeloyl-ACP methyl ester carboxylesterase